MSWREPALSDSEGCRGAAFFASPSRRMRASGHGDATKRYQVPIDGSEVTCHDEIVQMASKKPTCR